MLIVMKKGAQRREIEAVLQVVDEMGFRGHELPGETRTAIGITGNNGSVDPAHFENMSGVARAISVTKPFKLITRDARSEPSVISIGNESVGGGGLAVIAGPCAVETKEQVFEIARIVADSGVKMFRGGAYKPRSSPYSFQGLGEEGLKMLRDVRERHGLAIVTEAMDEHGLDMVVKYGDCIQIGARNMQNFTLLKYAGQAKLPVLLKRGMSATLDEFLLAAEYIMSEGNYNVILCERGIRTFADHSRNTVDISVIPAVQRTSHLPIIVDPSHSTGHNYMVDPIARAAVAAGADGIIIDVHTRPQEALCDGAQALKPEQYLQMLHKLRTLHRLLIEAEVQTSAAISNE